MVHTSGGLLLILEKDAFDIHPSKPNELIEIVRLLNRNFENSPEYWNWKYVSNPTIDPSLILVVENGKKIVGCGCWLPRTLKISSQLEINSILASHITVDREYRKHGIGKLLVESIRTSQASAYKKYSISLSLILESPLYQNFYKRITAHVPVSNSTTVYAKFLTCEMLKKRIDFLNKKIQSKPKIGSELSKLSLSIRFSLKGAPPFILRFTEKGIELKEEYLADKTKTSYTVKGDFMFLKDLSEGSRSISALIVGTLKRKIGLRGNPLFLFKLYKAYKLMKKAYRE